MQMYTHRHTHTPTPIALARGSVSSLNSVRLAVLNLQNLISATKNSFNFLCTFYVSNNSLIRFTTVFGDLYTGKCLQDCTTLNTEDMDGLREFQRNVTWEKTL